MIEKERETSSIPIEIESVFDGVCKCHIICPDLVKSVSNARQSRARREFNFYGNGQVTQLKVKMITEEMDISGGRIVGVQMKGRYRTIAWGQTIK